MVKSAADRMRDRVRALLDRKGRSQRKLALALEEAGLGVDHSELSRKLSDDESKQRDFTLRQLDAVAAYCDVPPSALIKDETSELQELSREEVRLISHWRSWPDDVKDQCIGLLEYFAGQLPTQNEKDRMWIKWRRLNAGERLIVERTMEDVRRGRRTARGADTETAAQESSPATQPSTHAQPHDRKAK